LSICDLLLIYLKSCHGWDRMVVGFTITLYICNQNSVPITTVVVSLNPAHARCTR